MAQVTRERIAHMNLKIGAIMSGGHPVESEQAVPVVTELMPDVLAALRGAARTEIHAFLVTAQDPLNELAPAELLAGIPFTTRIELHASQSRLLRLPAAERQRRVLRLIESNKRSMDECMR